MGFLDGVAERLKEINEGRIEGKVDRLTNDIKSIESRFRSDAKKFGIDIGRKATGDYYGALGIKYTNDQKAIREAYVKMIKKYHPDISEESTAKEKSEEINEAYGVLKDRAKKLDYDTAFSKGANKLGPDTTKYMSEMLFNKYIEIREKEFDEFSKRVSIPQQRDAIKAAIEDVADWQKRFNKSVSMVFGTLLDEIKAIRRFDLASKSLMKRKEFARYYDRLSQNARTISMLLQSADEIEKGIKAVVSNIKSRIGADEAKVVRKLRDAV